MAEIFAEMTFIFGDVHCDPHQVTGSILPMFCLWRQALATRTLMSAVSGYYIRMI